MKIHKANERLDIIFDDFKNESTHVIRGHVTEVEAREAIEKDIGEKFGELKTLDHEYGRNVFASRDSEFDRDFITRKERTRGAFAVTIVVFKNGD
jgi:hypothetical protein